MSDHNDNPETTNLRRVNAELTDSLQRCRHLVDDCRAKLAANSNEPIDFDNDDGAEEDSDRA